jgi:hypothetical protein
VAAGCHTLTATYLNGDIRLSFAAVLKYYSVNTDIAIIKINAQGLPHFDVVGKKYIYAMQKNRIELAGYLVTKPEAQFLRSFRPAQRLPMPG